MSENWDYSELSKRAKLNGGPEEFIRKIEQKGYNTGYNDGAQNSRQGTLFGMAGGLFVGWAATEIWNNRREITTKIKDIWYSLFPPALPEEAYVSDEEAAEAREKLLEILNEEQQADIYTEDQDAAPIEDFENASNPMEHHEDADPIENTDQIEDRSDEPAETGEE